MPAPPVPAILSRYRDPVDAALREAIGPGKGLLIDAVRYHLGWLNERLEPEPGGSGKAVRPALCLFTCEAVSGAWQRALPAATAIELVHNFSLIHDDIQDGDTERRHRPTVWYVWGYSHGLNAGNALNALANQAMRRLGTGVLSGGELLEEERLLAQACLAMIEGQTLDMAFESRPRVTVDEYLDMVGKKTGALLEVSVRLGAAAGGAPPGVMAGMEAFGRAAGRLFQVRDDMLGIWGKAEETGKPVASDLHRRKKSLPVVHALQSAGESEASRRFAAVYRNKDTLTGDEVKLLLDAMAELGTEEFCAALARTEAEKAWSALEALPVSAWAKDEAAALVRFLLEREF